MGFCSRCGKNVSIPDAYINNSIVANNSIEGIRSDFQNFKNKIEHEKELVVNALNARILKMERFIGARIVMTSHLLEDIPENIQSSDEWIEKIQVGEMTSLFSEPREELRPFTNIDGLSDEEESWAEEYTNLERKLKKATKQNNKKRIEEKGYIMNKIRSEP